MILCASLNRGVMTTNVHPLYLPPVVCWLNRTCVHVRRVKTVVFDVLKVISSVLVLATIAVHALRLWNWFLWGSLGALWSLMVCVTLIGGYVLTLLSTEKRNHSSNTATIVDPLAGVSMYQKILMFTFFLTTYNYTWLYYQLCGSAEVVVSWIDCSSRRGPSLFPILTWTTFVFVWINAIGFVRLLQ